MLIYAKPELSDCDEITALYRKYLNDGESVREYVAEGLADEESVGVKCVDTDTGRIVGVLTIRRGIQFTCEHEEIAEKIRARWGTEGVYTGDMLVVLPAYQGRGIGRELAVRSTEELRRRGARCMIKEEWHRFSEKDAPAFKAMSHFGKRTIVCEDPHFYKDLPKYGLTCPLCGTNCTCGAIVSVVEY